MQVGSGGKHFCGPDSLRTMAYTQAVIPLNVNIAVLSTTSNVGSATQRTGQFAMFSPLLLPVLFAERFCILAEGPRTLQGGA